MASAMEVAPVAVDEVAVAQKRPVEDQEVAGAAPPAKCARQTDPAKAARVSDILQNITEYPTETPVAARTMLAAGAAVVLAVAPEDRDDLQRRLVGSCREVLEEMDASIREASSAAGKAAADAEVTITSRQDELDMAKTKLDESCKAATEAGERLRADDEAVATAAAEMDNEQQAYKESTEARAETEAKLSEFQEAATRSFHALLTGGSAGDPEEDKALLAELKLVMSGARVDRAVVAAARAALLCSPAERGLFDQEACNAASAALKTYEDKLSGTIEKAKREESEAELDAAGAKAVHHVAVRRATAASAAAAAAGAALAEASTARDAAQASLKTLREEVSASLVEKTLLEQKAADLAVALEACRTAPVGGAGA